MKFSTTSAFVALGLAGSAAAGSPPPSSWSYGGPFGKPEGTCTATTTSTVLATSTTTTTTTETVYATVAEGKPSYAGPPGPVTLTITSTVIATGPPPASYVGPLGGAGGKPSGTPSGTPSSAASSNVGPWGGAGGAPSGAPSSVPAGPGGQGGKGGPGGHGGHGPPGFSGHSVISTLGTTGTNSYPLWTPTVGTTTTHPAPTYTSGSNTTEPNSGGGIDHGHCNTPSNRQTWCDGFDINTNYYSKWPNTGRTCSYDLTITNSTCNFDGTERLCLAISNNGGPATVPGPTIECNWGDNVVIKVTNAMADNGTAIHWHGIRQLGTNPNDGVPGVTECALAPGESRVYSWQATQYGSSWYHSHYLTQYGDGIRGPIIIHGPASANYDVDMGTVMVDDLFNLTAAQMNTLISHYGAYGASNYLLNGKNTSPDLSKGQHAQWTVESGKSYLFRIVNSASQNSWSMHFDNHNMTVIAADFVPIVPYTTDWLDITTGQRYDVIIKADQPVSNYFFRAVTQLACPSSTDNTGLGSANGIISYKGGNSTLLPTSTYGDIDVTTAFNICQDEPIASLVPWVALGAGTSTAFSASVSTVPAGNITVVLTSDDGAVFRWFLNGNGFINVNWTQPTLESLAQNATQLISNAVFLPQTSVQWVYFVIQNVFAVAHPMHLHGHDFALLGQGAGTFTSDMVSTLNFVNPARRDTAMLEGGTVQGGGYTVIGFETDNPGAWLMHCHIVWHVDGGLAMEFVERQDSIPAVQWTQNTEFQDQCSAYEAFQASGKGIKTSGESGLRKKWMEDDDATIVRRSQRSEKRYLDNIAARGLGDGFKPRHIARR